MAIIYERKEIDGMIRHLKELAKTPEDELRHKDVVDCALYLVNRLQSGGVDLGR